MLERRELVVWEVGAMLEWLEPVVWEMGTVLERQELVVLEIWGEKVIGLVRTDVLERKGVTES